MKKKSEWFIADKKEERAFERVKKAIKERRIEKLGEWLSEFGRGKGFIDFEKEFGGKESKKDWL